jgi:hypothetical protein
MTQWGVDTLFNPAKRHMDEEKRRLQSTRAEVGDNSGGKRIDLESGKVRISRAGTPSTPKDDTDEDDTDESGSDAAEEQPVDPAAAVAGTASDGVPPDGAEDD